MADILNHWVVVWIARVLLIVLMAGTTFILLLYLARFFRLKHILRMMKGELPGMPTGWSMKGGKLKTPMGELEFTRVDDAQDTQIDAVDKRLRTLEEDVERLTEAVDLISGALEKDGRHVQGTR